MITQQDLATLKRLYTPLAKILSEHLRVDHGYSSSEDRFEILFDEANELRSELASLKADYGELRKINQALELKNCYLQDSLCCFLKGPY